MSILKAIVIEDVEIIAIQLASVLQDLGFEVHIAGDLGSAAGLIAAESHSGGFLVHTLDIMLKGNNGLDLLKAHPNALTRDNTLIITSWEDRFRNEIERIGYKCVDKTSLNDRPYATLVSLILALPSVITAGVVPPWDAKHES